MFETRSRESPLTALACHTVSSAQVVIYRSVRTNFGLAHKTFYGQVKQLVLEKLETQWLSKATPEALSHYLKTWCKLLSRDYHPVLNLCSSVISGMHLPPLMPLSPYSIYPPRTAFVHSMLFLRALHLLDLFSPVCSKHRRKPNDATPKSTKTTK